MVHDTGSQHSVDVCVLELEVGNHGLEYKTTQKSESRLIQKREDFLYDGMPFRYEYHWPYESIDEFAVAYNR